MSIDNKPHEGPWGSEDVPIQKMTAEEAEAIRPGFAAHWAKCTEMANILNRMSPARREQCLGKLLAHSPAEHITTLRILATLPEFCHLVRAVRKNTSSGRCVFLFTPVGSGTRSSKAYPAWARSCSRAWTFDTTKFH